MFKRLPAAAMMLFTVVLSGCAMSRVKETDAKNGRPGGKN